MLFLGGGFVELRVVYCDGGLVGEAGEYLPVVVVVNRDGIGDSGVDDYCAAEDVPILMRIPFDRRIAEAISDGKPLVEELPEYRPRFVQLYQRIVQEVAR